MSQIRVEKLSKAYFVPERPAGLGSSLKSLFKKKYQCISAVEGISFSIQEGEMVGFIGPNGAGKTTTLKILSGLLYPSSGKVRVLGHVPWERETDYLRQISMVLGNKSQLMWDIPAMDTFKVLAEIYAVPPKAFRETIAELSNLLEIEQLLMRPVRNLSLGERMKCELVAALLHRPSVLFLDEPTIGLDVSMQRRLRGFIGTYNRKTGATVMLTSHYMADVVELCERVICIQEGILLFDGPLPELSAQLAPFKLIRLSLNRSVDGIDLPSNAYMLSNDDLRLSIRVDRQHTSEITSHLLNTLPVADLTVEDPPVEAVIDQIYQEGNGES
jgi:ABC-2 type transport system ATP-binding protein